MTVGKTIYADEDLDEEERSKKKYNLGVLRSFFISRPLLCSFCDTFPDFQARESLENAMVILNMPDLLSRKELLMTTRSAADNSTFIFIRIDDNALRQEEND